MFPKALKTSESRQLKQFNIHLKSHCLAKSRAI